MDAQVASPGPAEHRAEQRQRILDAAIACFSRDGFHGTSMQKICTEAGMSPGALYRYFPSKEALIGAIVESERIARAAVFEQLEASPTLIGGLFDAAASMLSDDTLACNKLGPEIMAEAIRNSRLRDALEPVEEETRMMLRAALARATETGEIDPASHLDDLVILLQVIGDGLVLHNQLHPEWNMLERLPALSVLVRRMLKPDAGGSGA